MTLAGAGTFFHQTYLAEARKRAPEKLFPKVRAFPGGGAPKPPQLHYDLKKEIGGVGIVSGYGLTECPILSMATAPTTPTTSWPTPRAGSRIDVDLKLVDGEIRVKAPQLCKGYLDASLNADAFDEDGYFRTGDLGELDDGYVIITGRLKDVIIRKGENISAKELEDLLHTHPKVAEAAVIGLPDPASGERACAVVASRDAGDPLGFDEMVEFLKGKGLMTQKLPEQLELIDALPRNPTGKVLKHQLQDEVQALGPRPSCDARVALPSPSTSLSASVAAVEDHEQRLARAPHLGAVAVGPVDVGGDEPEAGDAVLGAEDEVHALDVVEAGPHPLLGDLAGDAERPADVLAVDDHVVEDGDRLGAGRLAPLADRAAELVDDLRGALLAPAHAVPLGRLVEVEPALAPGRP